MKDISWPYNYSSFQLPLRIKTKHFKKEKSFLGKIWKKHFSCIFKGFLTLKQKWYEYDHNAALKKSSWSLFSRNIMAHPFIELLPLLYFTLSMFTVILSSRHNGLQHPQYIHCHFCKVWNWQQKRAVKNAR